MTNGDRTYGAHGARDSRRREEIPAFAGMTMKESLSAFSFSPRLVIDCFADESCFRK